MSEPGFYQQHLRGRASGRVSPRPAIRGPRREAVLARHGLLDQGAADPNQGQLFNPAAEGIPTIPADAYARSRGIPGPLASNAPGFMPGLQRKSGEKATRAAKALAIKHLGDARVRTGASRGGGPVKEAMEDRQALYDQGRAADWYQPVSEGRNVSGEGMAHQAISNAAARAGTSHADMTRAVALTSPRTTWDEGGAPGTSDYTMPNIHSAEAVVRNVHSMHPDERTPENLKAVGESTHGAALNSMKAKAALYHGAVPTTNPIGVADPSSQKVPNFEQSLHMSHVDPAVVRGAAGSYTVDAWDAAGSGADEKMLKSDMGYAVAHMTGVRTALKNWELPPNFQARTWNTMRDREQPASMGTNRLFISKRSGQIVPNPDATPRGAPEAPILDSRAQRRQSFADRYDLEF